MIGLRRIGIVAAALLLAGSAAHAQAPSSWARDSAEVRAALSHFLTAFENLDSRAFEATFDPAATVFFPLSEQPGRADGREPVAALFRTLFDAIRSRAAGPPYMHLDPENLRVEPLGPGVALVSFELHNGIRVARRTVVFRRAGDGWLILHLHASNMGSP